MFLAVRSSIAVLLMATLVVGCGTSLSPATLEVVTGTTVQPAAPTEIYAHIARGAMACWFAPAGPLKTTHIFHADAAGPSAGGSAEVVIFAREAGASDPRALRAFRVAIVPAGGGTQVTVENLKMPEPLAEAMKRDVLRWAGDADSCLAGGGPPAVGGAHGPAREAGPLPVKAPTPAR